MKAVQALQQQSASSQSVCTKGLTSLNCNQMGHIAAKCFDPQKKANCLICPKTGLGAKNCSTCLRVFTHNEDDSAQGKRVFSIRRYWQRSYAYNRVGCSRWTNSTEM